MYIYLREMALEANLRHLLKMGLVDKIDSTWEKRDKLEKEQHQSQELRVQ